MNIKVLATLGAILVFGATSCAPQVSRPVTERERTSIWGGLAGGAGGAVIGSMTGSALAGGLVGIPLGAAAGWYYGDQLALAQERDRTRDEELDRLRRENERLRRETDDIRRPSTSQAPASSSAERAASSSQSETTTQSTTGDQAGSSRQVGEQPSGGQASRQVTSYNHPDQIRQAQMQLNKRGFNAGPQDGVWGPETESAIREFQRSRGLEVTGRLNDRTMKELGVAERSSEQRTTSERRSN